MKDGDVVFLCTQELPGDLVGLPQSGLLLPALLAHTDAGLTGASTGDLLRDVLRLADRHNQRSGGFTEYLLLGLLETAGVAHHAVLAGVRTGRPFWFGTLRLFSQPELAGLPVRDTAGAVAVGAPTAPTAPGARASVSGPDDGAGDEIKIILRLTLTVSVGAVLLFVGNIGDIPETSSKSVNRLVL